LTQEDGSETDARATAIHSAARGEISSPLRTITFPRGIFVSTVSTEREACSRRRAVSFPLKTRFGRIAPERKLAISVTSRPERGPPVSRDASALFSCDPYSTTSASSRRRVSSPVAGSRSCRPRLPFSSIRSRLSTTPPR
jgi:hypothetical protein